MSTELYSAGQISFGKECFDFSPFFLVVEHQENLVWQIFPDNKSTYAVQMGCFLLPRHPEDSRGRSIRRRPFFGSVMAAYCCCPMDAATTSAFRAIITYAPLTLAAEAARKIGQIHSIRRATSEMRLYIWAMNPRGRGRVDQSVTAMLSMYYYVMQLTSEAGN